MHQKKLLHLMVASTLGLSNMMAQAEDAPEQLQEVEVTSEAVSTEENGYIELEKEANVGKMDVSVEDTPFSISIIDKNFIKDTGAKNIQDALQYTSGVTSGIFGSDTRGDFASVRGLDSSTYLDGLRQGYGYYNSVRTNTYALESIEVLKGPSSMLYGQGDIGGIINLTSKLPKEQAAGEIWAQYGTFNRKQFAIDATGPLTEDNTLLYRFVGLVRDSETQVDHVDNDGYVISPSLTWNVSDSTKLTLLLNRQENKGQVSAQFLPQVGTLTTGPLGKIDSDTFVGEPGWDKYDREKTELSLFIDHQFNDNWGISATTRYTNSKTETQEHWVSIPSTPAADGTAPRTIFTSDKETEILNFDVRAKGDFNLGPTHHKLVVGVDRQHARWEEDNYVYGYGLGGNINVYNPQYGNLNTAILATATDRPDNKIEQVGLYIADHIELGPVSLSLGLRRDWAENTLLALSGPDTKSKESETTGRIGLMYQFDNGISPYISYSEAFVMNTGTDGTANPSTLKPTTGNQEEVGVKYLSGNGSFAITAAYFDIEQENRVQDGLTPGGVSQVGATVEGFEIQINKRWKQFETLLAYTEISAEDDSTGNRLPYVAETTASWWNKLQVTNNFRVGAGLRYVGNNLGFSNSPKVPSFTLFDAMIGYTYKNWDFRLDAKNLADKEYVSWCRGEYAGGAAPGDCGYGERRTVQANVYYKF